MEDILQNIKQENEERIEKANLQCNVKIKELQAIKGEETKKTIRSWFIDGLYFNKKFHKAIITMNSDNENIGETEGGLKIKSPVLVKIFLADTISCINNENINNKKERKKKDLTEKQKEIIRQERMKPRKKRGEPKTDQHKKSVNELAKMLGISNRRIMQYCDEEGL